MILKIRELFNDKSIVGSPKVHFVKLMLIMMLMWLLLSGRFEAKFLIYGVATATICSIICMPLMILGGVTGEKKYFVFNFNFFHMILYLVWLAWQLILANIEVAKAVVSPDMKIDTEVVRFKVHFDNPMALTVLANSITLTPGTVTMNVTDDGIFEIHALTVGSAEGIVAGDMQVHVAKLFKEDENFVILDRIRDIEAAQQAGIVSTSKIVGTMSTTVRHDLHGDANTQHGEHDDRHIDGDAVHGEEA